MIGYKQSALQVIQTKKADYLDKIKKVDIDIFNSGVKKNYLRQYFFKAAPDNKKGRIQKIFSDKHNLLLHFKILRTDSDSVQSLFLDQTHVLTTQHVITKDETYDLVICHLMEPGEHVLDLRTVNGYVERFVFHMLEQELEKGSVIDIPQIAYRDALLNVVKLWLLSSRWDRVRKPDWAGFFDDRLQRFPMNETGARQLEQELSQTLLDKIKNVVISETTATPKLSDRSWDVGLTALDTQTKIIAKYNADIDTKKSMYLEDENVVILREHTEASTESQNFQTEINEQLAKIKG